MAFSTNARRVGSHECDLMKRMYPGKVEHVTGFPATMCLETDNAYLHFGGPKEKYRPYLVLVGRPVGFEGDFPGNIRELTYDRDIDREPVEYVYELSRRNLADMTLKGMYEQGFMVPDVIRKNLYELPCKCELYYTEAEFGEKGKEKKSCLIFVRPEDGGYADEENSLICADDDMVIDGREITGSGYDIHKYFEPVLSPEEQQESDGYLLEEEQFIAEDEVAESYDTALHSEHPEDYLGYEEEQEKTDEAEVQEEHGPEVDPELYEAMKNEADSMYEERKNRKELPLSERNNELMPDEPDEPVELDREPDELSDGEDLAGDDEDEAEKRKKREAIRTNVAENVDTVQEVIAAGRNLDPRAAQHVEHGVVEDAKDALEAARAGDRSIQNVPEFLTGNEADIDPQLES